MVKKIEVAGYPTKKKQILLNDQTWHQLIKYTWANRIGWEVCAVPDCKRRAINNPHHIFPKSMGFAIRWEPKNGIYLCASHHSLSVPCAHNVPVNDPMWFDSILRIYYTSEQIDTLAMTARSTKLGGYSSGEMSIILFDLQKRLAVEKEKFERRGGEIC